MATLLIVLSTAAFFIGAVASFLSGRFLLGFLLPIACLMIYLLLVAAHQGGNLEGFLTVLVWSVALLFALGVPVALTSAVGATLGVALSKARDPSDE